MVSQFVDTGNGSVSKLGLQMKRFLENVHQFLSENRRKVGCPSLREKGRQVTRSKFNSLMYLANSVPVNSVSSKSCKLELLIVFALSMLG